jgi:hypothetical protein
MAKGRDEMPDEEGIEPPVPDETDPDTGDPVPPSDDPIPELGEAEGKDPYGDRDDVVQDDRSAVEEGEVTS